MIDFQTSPAQYRHWRVEYDRDVATVFMDVDEQGGLFDGYELKLNSYDLGVDIELADIIQRMRFEHPEVGAVVMRSGKDNVFCAGANIRMLGGAEHVHKVNFCKFTNETRNTYEAAGAESGQTWIAAIKGSCAGGGYELALACDHIILADDGSSNVALPEVPLLAVLPGTGGLTRVTDKRKVRRDRADVFCSIEEGVRGARALEWNLVDEVVANSRFDAAVTATALKFTEANRAKRATKGIQLPPIARDILSDGSVDYSSIEITLDRAASVATITIKGPENDGPTTVQALEDEGASAWMLRAARELDDAILHLRLNEPETGIVLFKTLGNAEILLTNERLILDNQDNWLAREILLYWKRILKRVDMTSRSLIALIEPGSCFAGILAELLFAADRSYMAEGEFEGDNRPVAAITLSAANFGPLPMGNDLTRLETRFLGTPQAVVTAKTHVGEALAAQAADDLGLVTYTLDDIDWEDEIRVFLEERTSFSPDAMTGMEANLRFAGPETMETRIFGRLTAWQNWIFQRPNAVGPQGALKSYGTGKRGKYDRRRV